MGINPFWKNLIVDAGISMPCMVDCRQTSRLIQQSVSHSVGQKLP